MTPTIEKCKPGLPTTEAFGMELPIIADLGGGCFLVAHPNGAGIANKACLSGLHQFSTLMPQQIQIKALEEFEKFAWPLVRGQFYDQPIETCEVDWAFGDETELSRAIDTIQAMAEELEDDWKIRRWIVLDKDSS